MHVQVSVYKDYNACFLYRFSDLRNSSMLPQRELTSLGKLNCLSACQETIYWTLSRQVGEEEAPEEPIVFLHGVGIGLVSSSVH